MKINKYLTGGAPLFSVYKPGVQGTPQEQTSAAPQQTSDSSTESESKVSDKDLLNLIKDLKGLKSDQTYAIQQVQHLLMNPNIRDSRTLYQAYLQTVKLVNDLSRNNTEYENAYKKVSENNGLNQIAVNSRGQVVVWNPNQGVQSITTVSVKQYLQNQDNYQPLTNSQLLYLRDNNDSFKMDNSVFEVVENGIGFDKITDLIQQVTNKIQSDKIQMSGYNAAQQNQIVKGIDLLKEFAQGQSDSLMTIDGVYKSEIVSENNKKQMLAALQYIYATLPNNAKALLAIQSGNANNPQQGAYDMILQLFASVEKSDIKFDIDYQNDLNSDGSKKSEKSISDYEPNTAEKLQLGLIGEQHAYTFKLTGNDIGWSSIGRTVAITDGSKRLGMCTLDDIAKTDFYGALDYNSIYTANGAKISPQNVNEVLTDGKVTIVDLPYTTDEKGNIHPDFKMYDKLQEIEQYCKDNKIAANDYQRRNELLKRNEIPVQYEQQSDGSYRLSPQRCMQFAVFNANVISTAFETKPTMDNVDEIDDSDKIKQILRKLENINGYKPEFDENNWYDWNGHDDVYKMIVFMPFSSNILTTQNNDKVSVSTQMELDSRTRHNQLQQTQPYQNGKTMSKQQ